MDIFEELKNDSLHSEGKEHKTIHLKMQTIL